MSEDNLLDVWNEITISASGIGITLYSEWQGDGARVEDETWYTFDELESLSGEIVSLNLSDESKSRMDDWSAPSTEELLEATGQQSDKSQVSNLPEVDSLVEDTGAPSWSEDSRVLVTDVLPHTTADEFMTKGQNKSVAQENAEYPADDPVVLGEYWDSDSGKEYAFPASRLSNN